jgi:hypothetical protein
MFSDDYLLRIIRQATAVFAKIIGLKSVGKYQEALQVIDQTLEQLVGIDAEMIRLLNDESLYILLTKNEIIDLEKLGFIADLFMEEGDIHKLRNQNSESINCYMRSLTYYLVISINSETSRSIELSRKIDDLLENLDTNSLEEQTLLNLYTHWENSMEFAKADAVLNTLATRDGFTAVIKDEMKSFYTRLLEKSPKELEMGGMNRTQIRNKLKELE